MFASDFKEFINKAIRAVLLAAVLLGAASPLLAARQVAYIHGDVAADGTVPSGAAVPYDPMLLDDTGNKGCSQFKALVEGEGYTITQHYDQTTTLDAGFLNPFDVVVFGLHQKLWSAAEKAALDAWIRAGGGILMYSDSAAGGAFNIVGIKNTVGQSVVNNILSAYGMQVTVDQGGGTRAYASSAGSGNPIVWDQPEFEGEGVSPVAIDPAGGAIALIPFDSTHQVSGTSLTIDAQNVTIANPVWATLALQQVGEGHVMAIFDRQPLWNAGPGSNITKRDNREVLRRIIRFLARDYGNSPEWLGFRLEEAAAPNLAVSYRQWSGGVGSSGFDYNARNNRIALEQQGALEIGGWRQEAALVEEIAATAVDAESERVMIRLHPDTGADRWFARLAVVPEPTPVLPSVEAGADRMVALDGSVWLEASATGAVSQTWTKLSGLGTVVFANAVSLQTTATFSQPGIYELQITASSPAGSSSDTLQVRVVDEAAATVIAINCGGPAYSGVNGFSYLADTWFNGGGIDNFPGNQVAATGDDALYNTARSKGGFTGYSIPVANGNHTVLLQFAETFWTSNNARVFDLSIEGTLVLDDLDIHASAPGKWVAYDRSFITTVSDGILNISVSASVNNPLINAIVLVSE